MILSVTAHVLYTITRTQTLDSSYAISRQCTVKLLWVSMRNVFHSVWHFLREMPLLRALQYMILVAKEGFRICVVGYGNCRVIVNTWMNTFRIFLSHVNINKQRFSPSEYTEQRVFFPYTPIRILYVQFYCNSENIFENWRSRQACEFFFSFFNILKFNVKQQDSTIVGR